MSFLLIPNGQYSSPLEGSVRQLAGEPARLMLGAAVETLYTPSRFIGINSHLPDRPMSGWFIEGNLMERS